MWVIFFLFKGLRAEKGWVLASKYKVHRIAPILNWNYNFIKSITITTTKATAGSTTVGREAIVNNGRCSKS